MGYCPLMHGRAFDVPEIQAVASRYGVSEAQVTLAWHRAKGVTPIPKATTPAHVRDNYESLSLELDDEASSVSTASTTDDGSATRSSRRTGGRPETLAAVRQPKVDGRLRRLPKP